MNMDFKEIKIRWYHRLLCLIKGHRWEEGGEYRGYFCTRCFKDTDW